jgi:arylsulfatase A-like enzyme
MIGTAMKFLLALLAATFALLASSRAAPPNVVLILVDDLGYADIGPFGATKQRTPHLDRMAREGMKLTSFYAAPVCSVSRAQLLTGCYGARVSVPGVFGPASRHGLHPGENTIADLLRARGYATRCVGKWHLGDQPEFLPTRQGFDHYFGIPYSNDMQRVAQESGAKVVPLVRDEVVAELLADEDQSRLVERYTEEALAFIREHRDRPFFLYFPHSAVHTPIWPGEAFRGTSSNGRFGDWVQEVDWSVGRVLDTLRELGLDADTLVFFTSDNGPWLSKGADGGSALPLRGGKGSTWEGGVRVPTLAWWPGRIAPGSVCDAVAGTIDLLPTCVALAGGTIPPEPVIDGRDLSPLLFGQTRESPREAHYYFAGYQLQAVRQGPWKLALAPQPESMGQGHAEDARIHPRLYHLGQDLSEGVNLADKHPDVVARLTALAERMSAEIGGRDPRARRPAGLAEPPRTLYPSQEPPRRNEKKASAAPAPPAALGDLRPGDTLPPDRAPRVAATPFALRGEVAATQTDAVLVAHGGASVGYALHLRGGTLVWSVRRGKSLAAAATAFPADGQPHRIAASLARDGTLAVQVDDGPSASVAGPGLLPAEPKEDFCVGHDNGVPVVPDAPPTAFQGRITDLRVTAE